MESVAAFLIKNNKEIDIDYYKKYSLTEEDFQEKAILEEVVVEEFIDLEGSECNVEDTKDISTILCNKLKEYRTNMARIENNKPYFIYNNNTLDEIVAMKPKTKEELLKVKGFGPVKVEKYGEGILNIINEVV